MRKPRQTREQKQHAREQRALLRLRKAAVRYSLLTEDGAGQPRYRGSPNDFPMAFAELQAACDAFRNTLTVREQRKLSELQLAKPEPELDQEQVELHLSDGRVLVIPENPTREGNL